MAFANIRRHSLTFSMFQSVRWPLLRAKVVQVVNVFGVPAAFCYVGERPFETFDSQRFGGWFAPVPGCRTILRVTL